MSKLDYAFYIALSLLGTAGAVSVLAAMAEALRWAVEVVG